MVVFDDKVLAFRRHLECLGYKPNSCRKFPAAVKEFLDFCHEKGIRQTRKITFNHITQFYHYLQNRPNKRRPGGLSEIMVYQSMLAVRLFFSYLEQIGEIKFNPSNIPVISSPHYPDREILTIDEINILFEVSETSLEKALLAVFYGCGLRRSEVVALDTRDIDFAHSVIYIREGKGGKRRAVPMTWPIASYLVPGIKRICFWTSGFAMTCYFLFFFFIEGSHRESRPINRLRIYPQGREFIHRQIIRFSKS